MSLEEIAKKMCAKGRGILAADESTEQWKKIKKCWNRLQKNQLNFKKHCSNQSDERIYRCNLI